MEEGLLGLLQLKARIFHLLCLLPLHFSLPMRTEIKHVFCGALESRVTISVISNKAALSTTSARQVDAGTREAGLRGDAA